MEGVGCVADLKILELTLFDFSFKIFLCRIKHFVRIFFALMYNWSGLLCQMFWPNFWLSLKVVGQVARLIEIKINTIKY